MAACLRKGVVFSERGCYTGEVAVCGCGCRERTDGMRYVKQFSIILAVTCVGELLKFLLPFPIPASIYGLLVLLAALCFKVIRLEQVKEAGDFLIQIMPVMFIPAAAGLLTSWEQMRGMLLPLCVIVPVSTCLVMLVTGKVAGRMIGRKEKR